VDDDEWVDEPTPTPPIPELYVAWEPPEAIGELLDAQGETLMWVYPKPNPIGFSR
jgi:hypothetical protein